MADPPRHRGTEENVGVGVGPGGGALSKTPRWVIALGIVIVIALIGLMIVLHLTGILGPSAH